MNRIEILKKTKLFVLDMDGTFYLGEHVLDGALDFISSVKKAGKDFIFFTNNSSKSPELYIEKLAKMGCIISREKIMTSADVTITYLKKYHKNAKIYLVGTDSLIKMFEAEKICLDDKKPDIVVVGFDTTLTYIKLEKACSFIRNGAIFYATHPDINCPVENGFIPDVGSFCAAISLSTGVTPKIFGKPHVETLESILDNYKSKKEEIAFVGDPVQRQLPGAGGLRVLHGRQPHRLQRRPLLEAAVYLRGQHPGQGNGGDIGAAGQQLAGRPGDPLKERGPLFDRQQEKIQLGGRPAGAAGHVPGVLPGLGPAQSGRRQLCPGAAAVSGRKGAGVRHQRHPAHRQAVRRQHHQLRPV